MLNDNLILLTDSYKVSHAKQYPPKTSKVYSYFESRGGEFDETVFFGLQYLLKRYLEGVRITPAAIKEAEEMYAAHLAPGLFNKEGWMYIWEKHGGKLPVAIRAVPEGSVIPNKNVLMTIENTDPNCFWLTNYLETLLVQVWYPSTVATISRNMKGIILGALKRSGNPDLIGFKLHDFGCRGVSTMEAAAIGGAAHLVNFMGTDTVPALQLLRDYYSAKMAGFSIPAAEHSTMTSWGRDNEADAYRNMLDTFPKGLVAVVSDSYDIYNAVSRIWGGSLRDKILARGPNDTLVIRPDSGDPRKVVPDILDLLGKKFETITNDKGYKVLDPRVRVIQGDGIDRNTLAGILEAVMNRGWSADNIAFGSGGGLLQQCNRDTLKFAFKCSSATVNGVDRDVYKQPATASWKKSKKGRLALVNSSVFETSLGARWATVEEHLDEDFGGNQLKLVFKNGEILQETNLDAVRERAKLT
jgi:nicotinamide phosphoribosyltransferase